MKRPKQLPQHRRQCAAACGHTFGRCEPCLAFEGFARVAYPDHGVIRAGGALLEALQAAVQRLDNGDAGQAASALRSALEAGASSPARGAAA